MNRIYGTDANEILIGDTNSQDLQDWIYGAGGGDRLSGGQDNDRLWGDAGDDILGDLYFNGFGYREPGNDWLNGGDGNDRLGGGDGDDFLFGGDGSDWLGAFIDTSQGGGYYGSDAGNDVMYGGNGDDYISGGDGEDRLFGGAGNDTMGGFNSYTPYYFGFDEGDDIYYGGAGNDRIIDVGGNDVLYGDEGDDFLGNYLGTRSGGVAVGDDRMYGGAGDDTIYGGSGDDQLWGNDGNDKIGIRQVDQMTALNTEKGDDRMYGGAGDDVIHGGEGKDTVIGGRGNDVVYGDDDADDVIGVNPESRSAGRGEIDTLVGDVGTNYPFYTPGGDRFILGNASQVFYNDGLRNTDGATDYALIKDFSLVQGDRLQLKGAAADYRLGSSSVASGTAIFWNKGQSVGELIAIVQGDALTSFTSGFEFV
jgi:Ca2+-binding RTX toxin-like protein